MCFSSGRENSDAEGSGHGSAVAVADSGMFERMSECEVSAADLVPDAVVAEGQALPSEVEPGPLLRENEAEAAEVSQDVGPDLSGGSGLLPSPGGFLQASSSSAVSVPAPGDLLPASGGPALAPGDALPDDSLQAPDPFPRAPAMGISRARHEDSFVWGLFRFTWSDVHRTVVGRRPVRIIIVQGHRLQKGYQPDRSVTC